MPDALALKIYLSLCVVAGALMCFYGYRLFLVALGLFGALVGGYAGLLIGTDLSPANQVVPVLVALVGSLLGGILMVTMYFLGVFIAGATLGGLLAAALTLHASPDVHLIAIAIIGAIGGIVALLVQRYVIVVATALNGAALIIGSVWMFLSQMTPVEAYHRLSQHLAPPNAMTVSGVHLYVLVGAWIVLGALGILVQFVIGEPKKPEHEPEPQAETAEE